MFVSLHINRRNGNTIVMNIWPFLEDDNVYKPHIYFLSAGFGCSGGIGPSLGTGALVSG